jgi:hypothetical protein
VILRSTVAAAYIALAMVVTVAYGSAGLATLLFFYVWAAAWLAFVLAWGWAARAAGRWNYHRSEPPRTRAGEAGPDGGRLAAEPEPEAVGPPPRERRQARKPLPA